MAQVMWDDLAVSPGNMTPNIQEEPDEGGGPLPTEQPPKMKGRRRLMQSLKRMSSSPSLAKLGRTSPSSSGYTLGGKASMSCVSLASSSSRHGHSYGHSISSTQSATFSTAPTSAASTPSPEAQISELSTRLRRLDGEISASAASGPRTAPLPPGLRPASKDGLLATAMGSRSSILPDDHATKPIARVRERRERKNFRFWDELPDEVRMHILKFLKPRELVRCSLVSKSLHHMCFDGQLWINLDTEQYYRDISAASLTRIMTRAGPFVRDLNLRGCVQMPERWGTDGHDISNACRNLEYFSLEGCRIDRSSVHHFLIRNPRLVHINFTGLKDISNSAMRIIAQSCPRLEHLNVTWCPNVDTRGLLRIVQSCTQLKDLRAGEIKGMSDPEFLLELFERNTLQRLTLSHCLDLDDVSLQLLVQGESPQIDPVTDQAIVPPRKLQHLDLSRCRGLTAKGVKCLANKLPFLVGLQLSQCVGLNDDAVTGIFDSVPHLTHLDLEELDELTDHSLQRLARSSCSSKLKHLNVSYCENLGDPGMLQILRTCDKLKSVVMDNTRVSDLSLTEAATQFSVRDQNRGRPAPLIPKASLHMVVYDCQRVSWLGVGHILKRNAEANRSEVISLKCFYGYQDTVNEHMKRVLRGDHKAAGRLGEKWEEYMRATDEAGLGGPNARRRRRRLREAALVHADEEENGPRNGRRRARSGGCAVM